MSMKKSFVEKLKKEEAYSIIKKILGDRFAPFNIKKYYDKDVVNLEDKKNPGQKWAYYNKNEKYLCLQVKDKANNFDTQICFFDDKIILLGYEKFNNNPHAKTMYQKEMFLKFGEAYKEYLHNQIDKELTL